MPKPELLLSKIPLAGGGRGVNGGVVGFFKMWLPTWVKLGRGWMKYVDVGSRVHRLSRQDMLPCQACIAPSPKPLDLSNCSQLEAKKRQFTRHHGPKPPLKSNLPHSIPFLCVCVRQTGWAKV